MQKTMKKFIPLFLVLLLATPSCASKTEQTSQNQQEVTQKSKQLYKGKIVGLSNKAKQISIKIGKDDKQKQIMVSFSDDTVGIEHAVKGHGVIIHYEMRDGKPFATLIKAKLAKLPKGVTEISVAEIDQLITAEKDFVLVDSRPSQRYSEGHLPTAISIPVCSMKELIDLLPKKKDKLLVFYCGGYT